MSKKIEKGLIEFSVNRSPYKLLHMHASNAVDEEGNEYNHNPERWVLQPYQKSTYKIKDTDASDILTHLTIIDQKKQELKNAETELAVELLKICEQARSNENDKANELEIEWNHLIYDLKNAEKDKEKMEIINHFLEEDE